MAEKILAAGAGKGLAALQKKTGLTLGGDHNDKPSDAYKYYIYDSHGKRHKKRKDLAYFHQIIGVPYDKRSRGRDANKDALLAQKLFNRAKLLDGFRVWKFRFGVQALIAEALPGVGGFVNGGLTMLLIVRPTKNVSGGMNMKMYGRMTTNAMIDLGFGIIPIFGSFGDGFWKANTRNALLFEEFLVERYQKEMIDSEKAERNARTPSRNRTQVDQQPQSESMLRSRKHTQRDDHYEPNSVRQERNHAQTNRSQNPDLAPKPPSQTIDGRHGDIHERLAKKSEGTSRPAKSSGTGGSWFGGNKGRPGKSTPHGSSGTGSHTMTQIHDAAPVRPPRPNNL